jgi:acyl-coenzyme A synthetase/AMP-(fatty) acid ligase
VIACWGERIHFTKLHIKRVPCVDNTLIRAKLGEVRSTVFALNSSKALIMRLVLLLRVLLIHQSQTTRRSRRVDLNSKAAFRFRAKWIHQKTKRT